MSKKGEIVKQQSRASQEAPGFSRLIAIELSFPQPVGGLVKSQ
jgi:hypothetical protein